jgi:HAD superfamily hydrolase (TIGR01509 family)
MALQALIFDVDGTLAETERDGHRRAFNLAFAEAGLDWQWSVEEYGRLLAVAGGKERIHYYIQHTCADWCSPKDLRGFIANLHAAKNQHYQSLLAKGAMPLRPGVRRLLEEAKGAGMRLAIATTSDLTNVIALLQQTLGTESPQWFDTIAAGDIVQAKKPAPDIYDYVLEHLGLPPSECIVFEDSHLGCQAACAAHLCPIITVNDYTQDQDFTGAKLVLNGLGEPDQPFTVLAGDAGDAKTVDLAFLQRLK